MFKLAFPLSFTLLAAGLLAATVEAQVVNGNFEAGFHDSNGAPASTCCGGDVTPNGWTAITPSRGQTPTEAWPSAYGGGTSAPSGANFWGVQYLDGSRTIEGRPRLSKGGIYQTVTNLVVGATYKLSFHSMANHRNNRSQAERWDVSFGNQTFSGTVVDAARAGTWMRDSVSFVATSPSQELRFTAVFLNGTAGEASEILNLDGVSLIQTAAPR